MNQQDLVTSLQEKAEAKKNRDESERALMLQSVKDLHNSSQEHVKRSLRDMEVMLKVETEERRLRLNEETMAQRRRDERREDAEARHQAELRAQMRKSFWTLIGAVGAAVIVAAAVTLAVVIYLPFKAMPQFLQVKTEELANAQAELVNTKAEMTRVIEAAKAEKEKVLELVQKAKADETKIKEGLPKLSQDVTDWALVKPILAHDQDGLTTFVQIPEYLKFTKDSRIQQANGKNYFPIQEAQK